MSWTALQVRSLRLEAEDVLGIELAPIDAAWAAKSMAMGLTFEWA